jgi:hypothetical protein
MKRLVSIVIVSLVAAVVLFAAFHHMRAQGETSTSVFKSAQAAVASKTDDHSSKPVSHTLLTTYFTQLTTGTSTPITPASEDNPIDNPTTFKCPWPGCTLEIEQSVQMCAGSASGNGWAPLAQVDGNWLSYSPYVGEVPADGKCVLTTSNQTTAVTPGKHTVQSFVWADDAASLANWHINYRVYIP